MTHFLKRRFIHVFVLALVQSISFWDQSEWLESVCILEIVGEVLGSRLIAEEKLTSVGVS